MRLTQFTPLFLLFVMLALVSCTSVQAPAAATESAAPAATEATTPASSAAASTSAETYTDPFAYCAAVGTIDQPDDRYTGEPVPENLVKSLMVAAGTPADAPMDVFQKGTYWRCMDGKVYACFVGANIPCESKADTSETPTQGMTDYCTSNPTAETIPAVATGRDTVYEWRCSDGKPEIVRQVTEVDAQGYPSNFWYELSPEQ